LLWGITKRVPTFAQNVEKFNKIHKSYISLFGFPLRRIQFIWLGVILPWKHGEKKPDDSAQ